MMKRIETASNMAMVGGDTYICSTAEFTQTTDAPDGTELQVVDESTHTVVKYCVAYGGYWNER